MRGPADLAGYRIGVNNYDDTAAVVARGMLRDHYGLGAPDVTWVVGDLDLPTRKSISAPVLGIRSSLVAAHPWLPAALMDAFEAAKAIAIDDLSNMQAPKVTLPWVVADADYEATRRVMNSDIWPYGLARNIAVLATTLRHLMEDGLLCRSLTVDDLFPCKLLRRHDPAMRAAHSIHTAVTGLGCGAGAGSGRNAAACIGAHGLLAEPG